LTEPVPQTSIERQGSAKCIVVEFGGSGRKWPNIGWLQLQCGGAKWQHGSYWKSEGAVAELSSGASGHTYAVQRVCNASHNYEVQHRQSATQMKCSTDAGVAMPCIPCHSYIFLYMSITVL
jgi:hypothetical protein